MLHLNMAINISYNIIKKNNKKYLFYKKYLIDTNIYWIFQILYNFTKL